MTTGSGAPRRHRVVIIGSGFGGLFAAKHLKRADVDVTLIAKTTHHLFQPLLYQVATGILSVGEIAPATRIILRKQKNAEVLLGEVVGIDLKDKTVTSKLLDWERVTPFDSLIVAAGAQQSYFGNDQFEAFAPGMKTVDDALELRGRILGAFEAAEVTTSQAERERRLTFVVGVEVMLNTMVTDVDYMGLTVKEKDGTEHRIDCACKVWSAGVQASPLGRQIAEQSEGTECDRAGRVIVEPDLTVKGHPRAFVIGDLMSVPGVPGQAQGAIQGAVYATKQIKAELKGSEKGEAPTTRKPFKYFDKGSMATVSRFSAVCQIGKLEFGGFLAWVAWLGLHLYYLVGSRNRLMAVISWFVTFLGRGRGQMAITERWVFARRALDQAKEQNNTPKAIG